MLEMMVALIAHSTEVIIAAHETLEDRSSNGSNATPFTHTSLVSRKSSLPFLEILKNDGHRVVELGTTHWTGDR